MKAGEKLIAGVSPEGKLRITQPDTGIQMVLVFDPQDVASVLYIGQLAEAINTLAVADGEEDESKTSS